MKDTKPLWLGLAVAAISIIVLVVVYANTSGQLVESENRVQQLQAQLGEKDTKIKELEESLARAEERMVNWQAEINELRTNVKILGTCIDRSEKVLQAESYEEFWALAGAGGESCDKAKAIISKVKLE